MKFETLEVKFENQVAWVALNRPDVRNAFNEVMIEDLIKVLDQVEKDDSVRVMVLTGNGKAFCAGADLNWMKKMKSMVAGGNRSYTNLPNSIPINPLKCPMA